MIDKRTIKSLRLDSKDSVRLHKISTRWPKEHEARDALRSLHPDAETLLAANTLRLRRLQDRLYADGHHAVLVIFQALDAAGKDGTIKHVLSGINPQGCEVSTFKQPSSEELGHTFLWRCMRRVPERGRIGLFNRSYYEDVLVTRVHPELLAAQKLPAPPKGKRFWMERFEDINAFERHLVRNGTLVIKFYLHVSKEEQRHRLLARLDDPDKHWKFSLSDLNERSHWDDYIKAYEDTLQHTSTEAAPWYIIPADHKWLCHLLVSEILCRSLEALKLKYPGIDEGKKSDLIAARALLESES